MNVYSIINQGKFTKVQLIKQLYKNLKFIMLDVLRLMIMIVYYVQELQMQEKEYTLNYIQRLSQKIIKTENQWKGSRFASGNDSDSEGEDDYDDFGQYEQFMQKYRGKNGDLKPLGLLIYRKFIRHLIALFLILLLISIPAALIYSQGGGISDFQKSASFSKSLLLFSIANLPHYRFDILSEHDLSTIQFHRDLTICTDIASILLILGFLLYWKIVAADMANHYAAKSPSPHLYCLQVNNIQGRTQEQIKKHFSKFGKIAQISSVRKYQNLLIQLNKIVKLVTKYKNQTNENRKQALLTKINSKYEQLSHQYLKKPAPAIQQCFVCYQEIKTRNRVADLYYFDIMPEKLSFDQPTASDIIDDFNSQEKMMPKVKKYKFEPLTLNWENFNINKCSHTLKTCFQGVLLIIMLFMILIALFLLNINSSHIKEQIRQTNLTKQYPEFNTEQSLSFQEMKNNKNNSQIVYTFCASLTYSTFKWEYYNLCQNYFSTQRNRFALMLVFSLLVAVINLLTNRILWALVAFRRYKTLAERNRFLIKSIFMFSLINSAILILFIREQHIGPILRSIVGSIFGFSQDVMKVAVYPEFNRQWYMNIGNQLMMNYVVSLIVFPHFHILLHWVRKKYRQIMTKKNKKIINDPNFNYCTFYAMALKAIFFSLMYSSCMPIFFLLCFLALNVQLYIGKFLLKKFVKEPVFVDNNAIQVAVQILPFALILHCITSILFTGVDEIFPTEDSYFNMEMSFQDRNLRRMQRGLVYIFLGLLISIFIWNQRRLSKIVVKYWLGRDSSKIECDLNMKFSQLKNNPAFLSSYKMRDNPKYKILYYAMTFFERHMNKIRNKSEQESINVDTQRTDMTGIQRKDTFQEYNSYYQNDQDHPNKVNHIEEQIESASNSQNSYRARDQQENFNQMSTPIINSPAIMLKQSNQKL